MTRVFLACFLSFLVTAASAQAPAPTPASPAPTGPTKTAAKKKPTAKPKQAGTPSVAAENGPCSIGVISAIGDRFSVQKFGVTVFANDKTLVPIDWGLDDLVMSRVRAATGGDPAIHRIAYPKGAFEPYFNPKARFLPDPAEGLPAIVRGITANTHCDRYLVAVRFKGELPNTHMELDGIGAYNQGVGSILRHSHLFAVFTIKMLDGTTYEEVRRSWGNFGERLARGLRITEDPLNRLDNSEFPDPPSSVAGSAVLRERTRALVAAGVDQLLTDYLKRQ